MLRRDPGFTLAAAVVLALGIGATAAIFTLIRSLLLEPLPYPDSARLVWINSIPPGSSNLTGLLGADFAEIRDRNHSYRSVAALIAGAWLVTTGNGAAETIVGARVSPGFFDTLQIRPLMGRVFYESEHRLGHEMEAIFSYRYWQRRFGGDPAIVGSRVTMDGISYEVVGIMPPGFPLASDSDMFAPLQMDGVYATGRRSHLMRVVARLKPGIPVEEAQREASAFASDFGARFPGDKGFSLRVSTFLDREVGDVRRSLWIFAAAVGCVLLIACSNVASLLLARGASRVREMAVRAAMGATRAVLIRQMLVESAILAVLGGALGLPLAIAGVRMLVKFYPRALPRSNEIRADLGVFLFALAISLICGAIFGIAPALRGSSIRFAEALKEGGRGRSTGPGGSRFRSALVIAEVALGVVLTASAGLLARSLHALTSVDPGYRVRGVVTLALAALGPKYRQMEECRRVFQNIVTDVSRLPGVEAAGASNWLPLQTDKNWVGLWTDAQPVHSEDAKTMVDNRVVTPGYFEAMGAPLIAGRVFEWTDRPETPRVMVINEAFARSYFPGGRAIGHRITLDIGAGYTAEVAGVVGNFREAALSEAPRPELFTPLAQTTIAGQTLVVRTAGDPAGFVPAIRAAIAAIDVNVPVYEVRTMQDRVDQSLAQYRLRQRLLAVFSSVALLLASLGVYCVIACAVAERRKEIGIRMALGARRSEVRRRVVWEGLRLTLLGLVLGLAGALAAARWLGSFLFGVHFADPVAFGATAAIFVLVAILASYFPSRRATAIDPLTALREE